MPWEYEQEWEEPEALESESDFERIKFEMDEKQHRQRYLNHGLHYALETGRPDTVKMFLDYGADPNCESTTNATPPSMWLEAVISKGLRPLEIAAINDDCVVFEYLLQNGADPRYVWKKLDERKLELCKFFAKHPEIFSKSILSMFSDEDLNDELRLEIHGVAMGFVELDRAGKMADGGLEILDSLIRLYFFKNISYDSNAALYFMAVFFKSLTCLNLLLNRVTRIDCNGLFTDFAPLHAVCRVPSEPDADDLPLCVASINDDLETVMFLLERGEMCIETEDGLLPVDYAYKEWATNVLRFFLLNGFTSKRIEDNQLHVACFLEDVVLVRKLIKGGADVNKLDGKGCVPLVVAIKMKNLNIVKLLLEAGANPEQCRSPSFSSRNNRGCQVSHFRHRCVLVTAAAEGNAKIVNAILNHRPGKIDLDSWEHELIVEAIRANNLETFTTLFELGVPILHSGRNNLFFWHVASSTGNFPILEQLVELDADPMYRRENPLARCTDPDCIQLLLEHGKEMQREQLTNIRELSRACSSALKEARGDVEIVKAYHEAGVYLALEFSVFDKACNRGFHDVIKYLLSQNPQLKKECHRLRFDRMELESFNKTIQLLFDQGCTFDICKDTDSHPYLGNGASYFVEQVFVFTKIVQESCGQTRRVGVVPLFELLMRTRDLSMVMLLRDCGIKVSTDKKFFERRIHKKLKKNGADAEFLRAAEQICLEPISLQNQCRIAIRRELFSVKHQDRHISDAIKELPLPNCLNEFLSFSGQHEFEYLRHCSLKIRREDGHNSDTVRPLPLPNWFEEFLKFRCRLESGYYLSRD